MRTWFKKAIKTSLAIPRIVRKSLFRSPFAANDPVFIGSYSEVYLYVPKRNCRLKTQKPSHKLAKRCLKNLENLVPGQPVFFDRVTAFNYARYEGGKDYTIMQAIVPDIAIEFDGIKRVLVLRPGYIRKKHIKICFPAARNGENLAPNKQFDEKLLTVTKQSTYLG